jgi:hypothetical protein
MSVSALGFRKVHSKVYKFYIVRKNISEHYFDKKASIEPEDF